MTARGWPEDWEERKGGKDCPLCASLGAGDNDHTLAVTDLPFSEVRLERRSLLPGYCIVVWKFGHVAEPTELDDDASTGYWRDVLVVVRAIQTRFNPMKVNLLTLGNWVPHLHTHVVPRYQNDPAPGGPLAYEAMFADEPMPTEELQRHADGIRAALTR
jgi:diadenosine tetraphosphate (Ap4A) HIT family hydrolase